MQVKQALSAGVAAYKLYPAGATTNSDSGVTDVSLVTDTLKAMADVRSCSAPHDFCSRQTWACPM